MIHILSSSFETTREVLKVKKGNHHQGFYTVDLFSEILHEGLCVTYICGGCMYVYM